MATAWREQFRPTTYGEMIGCNRFKKDAISWETPPPCLLFAGPPGTGKTSAAMVLARTYLQDFFDPVNFFSSNASDDRGIDFIRSLKSIARQGGVGVDRKVILLDEADSFTSQAQKALRQIMEEAHQTAIFILTVNDVAPLHRAIKDRCVRYNFKPHLDHEAEQMFLKVHTEKQLPDQWKNQYRNLNRLCEGSLRQAIDLLESTRKEDDALEEGLKSLSHGLSSAALLVVGGEYSDLAAQLRLEVERGMTRFSMLKGLLPKVRGLYDDPLDYYRFVSTWGDFVDKVATWPSDDYTFVDYFVAKLIEKKEVKKDE